MKKKNILFIILLIIFSISVVRIEFQNDTFFSIAVGRQIMDTGVDMQEHLTWHEGLMYTYSHWLFDLINVFLFDFAGFKAIYIFVILMTIITAISLYTVLKRLNKNFYCIPFIITLITIVMAGHYFTARAQIISYLLFILEVYFIEKLLDTNKKRYILGLLLISIIIANVHAAVWLLCLVFYLPYLAEAFFGYFSAKNRYKRMIARIEKKLKLKDNAEDIEVLKEKLEKLRRIYKKYEENENKNKKIYITEHKYIKTLIIVFVITLFTGLLTPIKDTPYTYIFKTMGGISPQNITELRPVAPIVDIEFLTYIIVIIFCIASNKAKINLADGFMILGLVFMAMSSVRCISYLLLIGSIPLTRIIFNYMNSYNKYDAIDIAYEKVINKYKFLKISFAFYMFVVALSVFTQVNFGKKFVNETKYPVAACEYILDNLDVESMRIYNEFNYGSYLEYKGIPVFIDSRSEMYTEQYNDTTVFQDYIDIEDGRKNYMEVFDKYNITHVLIPSDDIVAKYIFNDSNYKLIYEDSNFVLYERV